MEELEETAAEAGEVPSRHAVQGETAEEERQHQELPDQGHRGPQPHLMQHRHPEERATSASFSVCPYQ